MIMGIHHHPKSTIRKGIPRINISRVTVSIMDISLIMNMDLGMRMAAEPQGCM
jgi:hypothetical protein